MSNPDKAPNKLSTSPSGRAPDSSGGSWSGFFFKLFLFVGLCVGGYYGYLEYQRRNRYGGGNYGGGNYGGYGGSGMGGYNARGGGFNGPMYGGNRF